MSKFYKISSRNHGINSWVLLPVAAALVAAVIWFNYLSYIEDGIPRGDELNFYYPWAKAFAENPSFKSFMMPHSEHPQLLYKLTTLFNDFIGKYDLSYYQWLSPVVLFFYAVFFAIMSIRKKANFTWAFFSIFLVLAVASPYRHGQMTYDMISVIGLLGPLLMLYLMMRFEKIVNGGEFKKYEIIHILLIGLATQNITLKMFLLPFLVAIFVWVLFRLSLRKNIIPKKIFLVCFFSFGLLIFQDVLMSMAGYNSSVEGLSINIGLTFTGVMESTKLMFGSYPIPLSDMIFGLLYFSVMTVLFLLLINKDELVAAALIGIPVIAAIATLNLRGFVSAPRYQGLFVFYQIFPIYAGIICYQRYSLKSHKLILGALMSCFGILILGKDVYLYSKLNSSKGSVAKYYEPSRYAFENSTTFTKKELKNFGCFKKEQECTTMINDIQNKRGKPDLPK